MKKLSCIFVALFINGTTLAQVSNEPKKLKLPIKTSEKYQEQIEKIVKSNKKIIDRYTTKEEKEEIYAEIGKQINSEEEQKISFPCEKSYDAEKKVFTIYVTGSPIDKYNSKNFNPELEMQYSFTLHRKTLKSEIYSAQNAYGAQVQVVKKIENEFALTVPKLQIEIPYKDTQSGFDLIRIPYRDNYIRMNQEINLDPKEARVQEKNIACAFGFKPISPYYFEYSRNFEPTISSPNELRREIKGMSARLINLYVFNMSTGDIYKESRLP
jgi:hypothetical protein